MIIFIVSVCVKNKIHLNQLIRCINSIRKFHKNEIIYLINDSHEKFYDDILYVASSNININILESINKGSADQQVFKFILEINEIKDNTKCVIIQDSMILNKELSKINEIDDIKFIWHFTNHRLHWDIIEEPQCVFNIDNKILTHSDLIKFIIKTNYDDKFYKFALEKMEKKNEWCGCFGNCCIIKKTFLKKIEKFTNFVDMFALSTDNRQRRANESIFSLLCHYYLPNYDFEKSYDGLYYDGVNSFVPFSTNFDNLHWCTIHDFFSKISFNR